MKVYTYKKTFTYCILLQLEHQITYFPTKSQTTSKIAKITACWQKFCHYQTLKNCNTF